MLILALLGLPAYAFAPDATVAQGVEPDRIYQVHLEQQYRLRHGAAWQAFLQGEGHGWQATFDERTGLARSAFGPGIPIGQLSDRPSVDAALHAFLDRNTALTGLPVSSLRLQALAYDADQDAWTATLQQVVEGPVPAAGPQAVPGGTIDLSVDLSLDPLRTGGALADDAITDFRPALSAQGVAVWRGGIQVRIVRGRIIWMSIMTHPQAAEVDTLPLISVATAFGTAEGQGPAPQATHAPLGARLVVLPMERWGLGVDAPTGQTGTGLDYRLCWELRTRTEEPVGQWVSYVDARTGELLDTYNEIRFIGGTLTGTHDRRTVDGLTDQSPLPRLLVTGAKGDTVYTGDDGAWDLGASSTATAALSGTRVRVHNAGSGGEASATFSGDFNWTDANGSQAEIDSYVFLHQVLDWKDVYAPEVSTGGQLTSNVNINKDCNAYFDGSVNFFRSGGGCNNSGRIADVEYHEWGHGFHYYSLESGTFDGSISEGIADTIAFFQTGDHNVAPDFFTDGTAIRDVADNFVYPDDITGEVHQDGLIYGGAVWDLWQIMQADEGPDAAYEDIVATMKNAIKYGPTIPESYDAYMLGDDDDGDLTNGTPHQCQILEAFSEHGLVSSGGGSLVTFSHLPLANQGPGGAGYPLQADLLNMAPDCVDFELAQAVVQYSVDDGVTWQSAPLSLTGGGVEGSIPAQPSGTIIQYYLEGTSTGGDTIDLPQGSFKDPFTFAVGTLIELSCEDFEAGDGGYAHALLDGRDELGADDWTWGTPQGMGGDPDFAASGANVWGNDLGGGNYNGEYQDGKHNHLGSAPIDVSGHDRVIVQYKRWLQVEDGYWDTAQVSVNDAPVWTNYASPGGNSQDHSQQTLDQQWTPHTLLVDTSGVDAITLGWDIISDEGLHFGGWNIDDVCVYALAEDPPASDTGGGDAGATGDGGSGADDSGGDGWDVRHHGGCGCASAPGQGSGPLGLGLGMWVVGLAAGRRRRRE